MWTKYFAAAQIYFLLQKKNDEKKKCEEKKEKKNPEKNKHTGIIIVLRIVRENIRVGVVTETQRRERWRGEEGDCTLTLARRGS